MNTFFTTHFIKTALIFTGILLIAFAGLFLTGKYESCFKKGKTIRTHNQSDQKDCTFFNPK